ncbi:hypothetical protein NQ317_012319 [Molorchus minor]|uniref:Uncharacterized protein n=1 Tax=Molorchus minor TaxID=1323400 RepID=A0ABQ9IQW3_9CUCU|nr:hypothetical protein NQ317_012319 [Molorchus minor]
MKNDLQAIWGQEVEKVCLGHKETVSFEAQTRKVRKDSLSQSLVRFRPRNISGGPESKEKSSKGGHNPRHGRVPSENGA